MPGEEHNSTLNAKFAARMQRELSVLHHNITDLQRTVDRQAAEIASLKQDSARRERDLNLLWSYVLDELGHIMVWLEPIARKVLPQVARFTDELIAKVGEGRTVPPHRLNVRARGNTR